MYTSGLVNRDAVPTAVANASYAAMRVSNRGELVTVGAGPSFLTLLTDGSYRVHATSVGSATAPTSATRTSWSNTEACVVIVNGNAVGGKYLFLDYIKLHWTSAPTGSTRYEWLALVNTLAIYSSGGSSLSGNAVNPSLTPTTGATVYYGNVTTSATSTRIIGRGAISSSNASAGETYTLACTDNLGVNNTGSGSRIQTMRTAVIPPGSSLAFCLWGPGMTAAGQADCSVGLWEN